MKELKRRLLNVFQCFLVGYHSNYQHILHILKVYFVLFSLQILPLLKGALQIKEILPDTLFIFILPPTMKELKRRLENRGTEDKAKIDLSTRHFSEIKIASTFFAATSKSSLTTT